MISTSTRRAEHPFSGQNTQQLRQPDKKSYSAQTGGEMSSRVVTEVAGGQEVSLDCVVEAQLTNGHHYCPRSGPIGATEQFPETLFTKDLIKKIYKHL